LVDEGSEELVRPGFPTNVGFEVEVPDDAGREFASDRHPRFDRTGVRPTVVP